MKQLVFSLLLALCVSALTACGAKTGPAPSTAPTALDHTHAAAADNVLPHEDVGYCGNTVTGIRASGWETSFWGSDSVALSDLLLWLDYSDDPCSCVSEYTVTTEFSEDPYELDLTEGLARHAGKQVTLTDEQIETLRAILDRAKDGKTS